jgi:hypothetical protein
MTEETRRAFLSRLPWPATAAMAGATLGTLTLTSCTKHRTGPAPTAAGTAATGDLAMVSLAVALENLAVATYQEAMAAAGSGRFGPMPPAFSRFLATAQSQHRDHAASWNAGLTRIGKRTVAGVDLTLKGVELDAALGRVKNATDLAKFALFLENVMAATYLDAIQARLQSAAAIKIAATIQPVEMQHAAVLQFMIGIYPVPDGFAGSAGARPLSDQIG